MKPDWKDAPEWAQWLAQDLDGVWWWYADKPSLGIKTWATDLGAIAECATLSTGWKESLERRP